MICPFAPFALTGTGEHRQHTRAQRHDGKKQFSALQFGRNHHYPPSKPIHVEQNNCIPPSRQVDERALQDWAVVSQFFKNILTEPLFLLKKSLGEVPINFQKSWCKIIQTNNHISFYWENPYKKKHGKTF